MRRIILIAHNVRSTHNVGSLLRTADGMGVEKVYLTGYTPYPAHAGDIRMLHEASKIARQINKTALGAEETCSWEFIENISEVIDRLKPKGYQICALEQHKGAAKLPSLIPEEKTALIVGNEVSGINTGLLKRADAILEIPLFGKKESLNVVQAAAMALYHLRFM